MLLQGFTTAPFEGAVDHNLACTARAIRLHVTANPPDCGHHCLPLILWVASGA
jgi:hypothetical protein